jgi:hypothetical protein
VADRDLTLAVGFQSRLNATETFFNKTCRCIAFMSPFLAVNGASIGAVSPALESH